MNNSQNEIIIFCQAPADVQYVLSLYEKYKHNHQISLIVVNLEGIYHYFQSLKLNLKKIILIPYPKNVPLKNISKLIKIKAGLNYNFNSFFKDYQGQTVYFFSKYFDWLTAYHIARLSKMNRLILIDHSGDTFTGCEETSGLLISYRRLVYWYLTSIKFRFLKMQSTLMMEFPVENYRIETEKLLADPSVIAKYCVKTDTGNDKSILLFENNQSAYDFYVDYEPTITSIVDLFIKSGYKIYLKPHPRQGYSEFLKPYIEKVLPAEIPGEFFNADDFTFIAGIDSNALAFFARSYQLKTISLLELFNFRREDEKERFLQTQLKLSEGKMFFVPSISELKKLVI